MTGKIFICGNVRNMFQFILYFTIKTYKNKISIIIQVEYESIYNKISVYIVVGIQLMNLNFS